MKKTLRHPADRKPVEKAGPALAVAKATEYNPEAEAQETTVRVGDFAKRMGIPRKVFESSAFTIRGKVAVVRGYKDGRMIEAKAGKNGNVKIDAAPIKESVHTTKPGETKLAIEFERINSAKDFKRLVESDSWLTSKLLESYGLDAFDFGGADMSTAGIVGPPNDEYIPLLGGPFSKQLYLYDYLDMQAKCFWAKNHHPFAKAIVQTKRAYVIGKGVKLLFKNPDCQRAWEEFEKRADFPTKLRTDVETLIWGGEIMTEKATTDDGMPTVNQIDPSTVWEIVTDPATPEVALYYHQQFPTQWQLVYHPQDKVSEYIINDIPGNKVIHVKINTAPGEKRGRSDLFAVLSWLKRFRDYFNAKVVKAQMEESWGLDIAIDGSQADVTNWASDPAVTRIPPPGSTRVHNKQVEYSYLQPTSSSTQGTDNVGEQLKNIIAVGAGVAPEWLGESAAGSTKETARTKEGPAQRNIEDMQQVVERYIRQVAEFVLGTTPTIPATQVRPASIGNLKRAIQKRDWKAMQTEGMALLAGKMVTEPTDKGFEVIFPEPASEDRQAKLNAIIQAEAQRYFSHERAASMYAKEMGVTDYDANEEAEDIQAEQDLGGGNPEWGPDAGKGGKQGEETEDDEDDKPAAGKPKAKG